MDYKNPTLTEIYSELYLERGALPEKNLLLLARKLAEIGLDQLEFTHSIKTDGEEASPIVPRMRCWDGERVKLVQASPDSYFVNLIGEYPGWDAFVEHLHRSCNQLTDLGLSTNFVQVNLVTVDKWKVKKAGFRVGQYLQCSGLWVPEWFADVGVSCDMAIGTGFPKKDGFNKRVSINVRTSDEDASFQVIINFGEAGSKDGLDTLLNRLHKESVECFEALVTDRVREEVMGGSV